MSLLWLFVLEFHYCDIVCSGMSILWHRLFWNITSLTDCSGMSLLCHSLFWNVTSLTDCSGMSLLSHGLFWKITAVTWFFLECHSCHMVYSGMSLLSHGVLWNVTAVTWCTQECHCCHMVYSGMSLLWHGSENAWYTKAACMSLPVHHVSCYVLCFYHSRTFFWKILCDVLLHLMVQR